MTEDSFRTKGLRNKMIDELRSKGIQHEGVLEAMGKVPRHVFLDNAFIEFAYRDQAFPIGAGQTISQPSTVALQTQLLAPEKGEKVLEVGTGSGYQTSILCAMGCRVYSVERQKSLFDRTRRILPTLGYNPKLFFADGYKGLPGFAPFQKILVTAGAPYVPQELLNQLAPGGILVIPVGTEKQEMTKITRTTSGEFLTHTFGDCKFVPLLQQKQN
jgi:protein-L-isoaspartate(D-aspartate) O-methyltransferase